VTTAGLTVRRARDEDRSRAAAFYEELGRDPDRAREPGILILAEEADRLVGAVALYDEHGYIHLRTMVVREELRGQGVGGRLLDACVEAIGDRTCYLIGYGDLIDFYGRVGFRCISEEDAPGPLARRAVAYRHLAPEGHAEPRGGFVLMVRPAASEV